MVLFACGSRSISSVLWPLFATAAARLMVVVVLPTPPFWLATVMIIEGGEIVDDKWGRESVVRGRVSQKSPVFFLRLPRPGSRPRETHILYFPKSSVSRLSN